MIALDSNSIYFLRCLRHEAVAEIREPMFQESFYQTKSGAVITYKESLKLIEQGFLVSLNKEMYVGITETGKRVAEDG